MPDTDFRALCAELHEALEKRCETLEEDRLLDRSAAALRAALAQSEPVAPTDEALANFSGWFCRNYPGPDTIIHKPEWHAPKVFRAAADAIARYARPTIQPVAPESGYEKGYAQEHLARLMRDAIGTETNHNVYIVAAGKILDRTEFMHVARYYRPTIEPVS
jgi:hypothetical protein